jgi:hypothetical protein
VPPEGPGAMAEKAPYELTNDAPGADIGPIVGMDSYDAENDGSDGATGLGTEEIECCGKEP